MPQATDFVINNGAATPVAKTFSLVNPSGPSGTVALWALKEGLTKNVFATIEASSVRNASRDAQKGKYTFKLPSAYTDTTTGLPVVSANALVNITVTVPDAFPEASKNDLVAYVANLTNHALFKSMLRDGISGT